MITQQFDLHPLAMAPSFLSILGACALTALITLPKGVCAGVSYVAGATVSSTILVVARDQLSAQNGAFSGLQGYGIPYETLLVPKEGVTGLPVLNSTATHGNYGGIVVVSEVGYNYDAQYYSALTRAQWTALWNYQTQFGVRMVRLDVFPTSDFGVSSLGSNINDEPVVFTNTTGFATASLKT
jgi:hypothetical protein